jgi:fucose 4-O-acetylase-like acetyltransferase
MIKAPKKRINWIDLVKGFGIVLVIYAHNFPYLETYIYGFHMPLFFFISGLFHPKELSLTIVKKRAKQILIPYFIWSFLLFLFWFFIGRKFGDSNSLNLSAFKNFIGIFYAQGGVEYMNWGIPMWFLPAIFLNLIIFGFVKKIKRNSYQILCVVVLISFGFLIPKIFEINLIWSLDVSMVSLFFYVSAFYLKDFFFKMKNQYELTILFVLLLAHVFCSIYCSQKIDMYRSDYGNEFLFLLTASIGISFWVLFFKKIKKMRFLGFLGKNTIPILALHLRALTIIKLFLLLFWSSKSFAFNEVEKLFLVVLQLIILYPIIIFINKKVPVLNGKPKTLETRN